MCEVRLKNIFRNSFFSLLSQFVLIVIGFFSQKVMNLIMGEALVGMNSVISNIVAILSVSELGIASAIIFHLYKALAERNEEEIASLMNLYRKAYYIFGTTISVAGLCIMPFVHFFLKENSFSLSYIRLIYFLWLARTVLSYLLSYKRSILIADQREYVVSIVTLLINFLNYGSIIVILLLWQNYQVALFLNIIVESALNLWITWYVDRQYPFLKRYRKRPLQKGMMATIFGDIKNIFVSRLSSKMLVSTDNLIISSFISVVTVGLYANYSLITQSVTNIILALSNAMQPTVGNMFTEHNQDKNYHVLRQMGFIFFLLAAFCSASVMSLITIFVTDFWLLAERYALSVNIVACCTLNCFLFIMNLPTAMVMTVSGMFDKERNISILYATVNLVISLLLVKPFGVVGVLVGTSASYLVQIIFRIWFFFSNYLHRSSRRYVADMLQYGVLAVLEVIGTYYVVQMVYCEGGLLRFVLAMLVCVCLPNIVNALVFFKSWRMRSIVRMLKDMGPRKEIAQ